MASTTVLKIKCKDCGTTESVIDTAHKVGDPNWNCKEKPYVLYMAKLCAEHDVVVTDAATGKVLYDKHDPDSVFKDEEVKSWGCKDLATIALTILSLTMAIGKYGQHT